MKQGKALAWIYAIVLFQCCKTEVSTLKFSRFLKIRKQESINEWPTGDPTDDQTKSLNNFGCDWVCPTTANWKYYS